MHVYIYIFQYELVYRVHVCVSVYIHYFIIEYIRLHRDKGRYLADDTALFIHTYSHTHTHIYVFSHSNRKLHKYDKWLSSPFICGDVFYSTDCIVVCSTFIYSFFLLFLDYSPSLYGHTEIHIITSQTDERILFFHFQHFFSSLRCCCCSKR